MKTKHAFFLLGIFCFLAGPLAAQRLYEISRQNVAGAQVFSAPTTASAYSPAAAHNSALYNTGGGNALNVNTNNCTRLYAPFSSDAPAPSLSRPRRILANGGIVTYDSDEDDDDEKPSVTPGDPGNKPKENPVTDAWPLLLFAVAYVAFGIYRRSRHTRLAGGQLPVSSHESER